MVDIVTSQTIQDNARNLVVKFTDFSDGAGENLVTKISAASLTGPNPGAHMTLWTVWYDIQSMGLRILWGGTPNKDMIIIGAGNGGWLDFCTFGGITNNAAQPTGDVLFSTIGAIAGAHYTVTMLFKKGV